MRVITILALLLTAVCFALPVAAWDPAKQKNLGLDHVKMQWYIFDYGVREDGTPFAVARKYYTNDEIRNETIKLLMSKFGYSAEQAGKLNSTEYGYEYTKDGKQFAVMYLLHCEQDGQEIHRTIFDDSAEDKKKVFAAVNPNHAVGKALALAVPPARRR